MDTLTPSKFERTIPWYRSPVDPVEMKKLYERSDFLGAAQTLGYLGLLCITGASAVYAGIAHHWVLCVCLLFLHGTCFAFQINGVHELGHDTVFKTKALNRFFVHIMAFLGWMNHYMFDASHVRHHRSTLHPPDDLEVVVPIEITVKDFLRTGFINPRGILWVLKGTWKIATGKFEGEWTLKLFPPDNLEKRRPAILWARTLLVGHGAIVVGSLLFKLWLLPVVITFAPFYGGWLFFLCNNTQHVGLQDNSSDFRLCTRTFVPNPLVRFLYWHMNYHIEHHMYVGVPCYRLGKLHKLIEKDLPPSPQGILATWQEIGAILEIQAKDRGYRHVAQVPASKCEINA